MESIKRIDLRLMYALNSKMKCNTLDKIFLPVTYIGSATNSIGICLMIICLGNSFVRNIGIDALIGLIVSHAAVQILKNTVNRERPKDALQGIHTFDVPLDHYAFPSGHTTASFVIALTIAFNIPILSIFVLSIALLVALSRVYLGVHYPSDILAGMFVAIVTSIIVTVI